MIDSTMVVSLLNLPRPLFFKEGGLFLNSFFVVFLLLLPSLSSAIDDHQFADPDKQQTYENITSELRCLVCQNQTIADSNAELAADLRRQVYEMLQQGKSKDDITQFMTERYGDFVLYNPPLKAKTGLLWLGPVLFLLLGFGIVAWVIRQRKQQKPVRITPEQKAEIKQLLQDEDKP